MPAVERAGRPSLPVMRTGGAPPEPAGWWLPIAIVGIMFVIFVVCIR